MHWCRVMNSVRTESTQVWSSQYLQYPARTSTQQVLTVWRTVSSPMWSRGMGTVLAQLVWNMQPSGACRHTTGKLQSHADRAFRSLQVRCPAENPGDNNNVGASPVAQQAIRQECRRHRRLQFDPWVRKIPWRRKWQPTPVFLPGKSHGEKHLAGYSPWGHKRVGYNQQQQLEGH